jgi:hypothetical protein
MSKLLRNNASKSDFTFPLDAARVWRQHTEGAWMLAEGKEKNEAGAEATLAMLVQRL